MLRNIFSFAVNRSPLFKALCCSIFLFSTFSPAPALTPTQPVSALDYKISVLKVEIPFDYAMHQIIIHASTPGVPKLNLLLDTGSDYCILDSALKLDGFDDKPILVNMLQGKKRMMKFFLNSLKLGEGEKSVSVANLPILRNDFRKVGEKLKRRIDGVLGLSFLAGYVLEIDYARKTLRFSLPESNLTLEKGDDINSFLFELMQLRPKQPFSSLTLNGTLPQNRTHPFIVDTGFGGMACFTHKAAEESGLLQEDTGRSPTGTTNSEGVNRCESIIASKLLLGVIDLSGEKVLVDSPTPNDGERPGMIGNLFLENYLVIFDYKHKLLRMESRK